MTQASSQTGAQAARQAALLEGPPLRTMLGLGLPTIVVVLVQIGVSVLETYWVSRLGTDAVAGVSLVAPVIALMATMSNGGIGGGVSSAIARALGAGRTAEADGLVWHTVIIALAFGTLFTAAVLLGQSALYRAMGGRAEVLSEALVFSTWVFAGAIPLWLMNLLSAAMRGAGDVRYPALVSLAGAAFTALLSPVLIFGPGPLPAFGVAGAGMAVVSFYLVALTALVMRLRSAKSSVRLRIAPLKAAAFGAILGVGLVSALGTIFANLTTILVTAAVGGAGAAAIAGYGIASRIDFLLIPMLFGFATAVVTVVGVATGAGRPARAREAAWKAAALAFATTQSVGVVAAFFPASWMGFFSSDPDVIARGAEYLRFAAPVYGAFGAGLMLYFASQGLGKVHWPFLAGLTRLLVTGFLSWRLAEAFKGVTGPAIAVAAGYVLFGAINAIGFLSVTRRSETTQTAR